MEGTSTFELGKSGLTVLRGQGANVSVRVAFKQAGEEWRIFDAPGKGSGVQQINLGRSGKVWRGRMRRAPRKTDAITGVSNCLGALSEGGRIPGAGG